MSLPPILHWVLLWHECPPGYRGGSHWDLMLEREGVTDEHRLATWSLRELPAGWPGAAADGSAEVDAVALADHRAAYLDYEGPISGDRGAVSRIAAGDLTWSEASERRIACELRGDLGGELILTSHLIDQWRLEWRGVGA